MLIFPSTIFFPTGGKIQRDRQKANRQTDEKSDGWNIYLLRWRGGLARLTSTGKILCELEEGMDRWTDGLRRGMYGL